MKLKLAQASAAMAVAAMAQSAWAQDFNFYDGGGANNNWSTAANWNKTSASTPNVQTPDVEPVITDLVAINNGATVVINQLGEIAGRVRLGQSNQALTAGSPAQATSSPANLGQKGILNIMPGGELQDYGAFDLGNYTVGGPQAATTGSQLNVMGGSLYTGAFIRVGIGVGSEATVNLTSGLIDNGVTITGPSTTMFVGDSGTGTFNVSGGELKSARQINIGQNNGAKGFFNLTGGTVTNGNDLVISSNSGSQGTITQTAGSWNNNGRFMVGFLGGSLGVADLSGGSFQTGQIDVGRLGTGTVTIRGTSQVNVNSVISVAKYLDGANNSNGTFNVSGTADIGTGGLIVGERGNGTLNLSGGTIHVFGQVQGTGFPSNDDPFNAELLNLLVGRDGGGAGNGNGVVNHSGGTMEVATNMVIGDFDDSNGVYNISGGTLAITGNANIGSALASNAPAVPADTQGQAIGAKGTFHVIGNAATINIGGKFIANPGDRVRTGTANEATLAFDIGSAAGTSVINVGGVADLDGAKINLTLTGTTYVPDYHTTYTLLSAASFGATGTGSTQNTGTGMGYTLVGANAADFTLSVITVGGKQVLIATNEIVPGDANGNKIVNFDDLVPLAQNYNKLTGQTRADGDFNRNGGVNFDDLVVLAQNYNKNFNNPMLTELGFSEAFAADWALAQSLVPEPTTIGVMGAAALVAARRRRSL